MIEFISLKSVSRIYNVPNVIFTLEGNEKSVEVIKIFRNLKGTSGMEPIIFQNEKEIEAFFESGASPLSAVILYDSTGINKHFTLRAQGRREDSMRMPAWANGAQWGVQIFPRCNTRSCAEQVRAHFVRHFSDYISANYFPWGQPKKGESGPVRISLPPMDGILNRLNSGPDFAGSIADMAHAAELPKGSRISWIRVPHRPVQAKEQELSNILEAFRSFERASFHLAHKKPEEINPLLMAGVDLAEGMEPYYLNPPNDHFSVARPDLHYTSERNVFASENDEMPGGLPDLIHLDHAYGINADRWEGAFNWLTKEGALLFVVSNNWSKCYIPENVWLVEWLRNRNYPVKITTTDNLEDLSLNGEVRFKGEKVSVIWRQFPIFETEGKLTELVRAANDGVIKMVPEFGHFGNKTWFSIFRSHEMDFKELLSDEEFQIMDEVLPDSRLIIPGKENASFPFRILEIEIADLADLKNLKASLRNELVLKVAGANILSARSYGVLMGHDLPIEDWRRWINERVSLKQPFIVQRRAETSVEHIPVFNTKINRPEAFPCRVLIRPWRINGSLVSASACAVPSNTLRIHGRVDMAVLPIQFE